MGSWSQSIQGRLVGGGKVTSIMKTIYPPAKKWEATFHPWYLTLSGTTNCVVQIGQQVKMKAFYSWAVERQLCGLHALLDMRVNIWHPGVFP